MYVPKSVMDLVKRVFKEEGFFLDDFKIDYIDKPVPTNNGLFFDYGELSIERISTKNKKIYQTGIDIGNNLVSWDEQLKVDLKNGYFD